MLRIATSPSRGGLGRTVKSCLLYTSLWSGLVGHAPVDHLAGGLAAAGADIAEVLLLKGHAAAGPVSYTHLDVYKRQPLHPHLVGSGKASALCLH